MADENVSFDPKKLQIIIALTLTVFGAGYGLFEFGSTYHDKYATQSSMNSSITSLQVEILTVAKLAYEDQLVELDYLQATGKATELDKANRANVERRLDDLKGRLVTLQ